MPPFPLTPEIPPLELAPGVRLSLAVIPPLAVQQAALAQQQPLSFWMGERGQNNDQEPRHRVIIPAPFYLGVFPVTQAQFAAFKPDHKNGLPGKPEHPAERMDWHEAVAFGEWINETPELRAQLPAGFRACLPNEAQWEYACRAGTETEYSSGDGAAALAEVGWFEGNAGGSTHPVGMLKASAWGLHDLHGNVWEWCADDYDDTAYAQRADGWNAAVWSTAEDAPLRVMRRVVRGGSWVDSARGCRSACRVGRRPRDRLGSRGFRLCLSPVPVVEKEKETSQPGAEPADEAGRERGTSERKAQAAGGADLERLRAPRKPA